MSGTACREAWRGRGKRVEFPAMAEIRERPGAGAAVENAAGRLKPDFGKGDVVHGFEILEIIPMPELDAAGIYARHRGRGTEVFHVYNEDGENMFAFCFPTWSYDSTGVAHILEHSVLCGSKRYPLKDPFSVLRQGSLATYLNAWTFPDKTVYPASSVNRRDYFNLMAVYGDAVFAPLLEEQAFLQEGWRFEFSKDASGGSGLTVTGVVYNEMRGAYSDPDEYAEHSLTKYLLPGTPYSFDSGGDPKEIPGLTYRKFKAFHKKMYSRENCKIFLAGNIKTEEQLEFLDKNFLRGGKSARGGEDGGAADIMPEFRRGFYRGKLLRKAVVEAPAPAELKNTVFLGINLGVNVVKSPAKLLDFIVLDEILLGHDGSPLVRALLESGLGEDLANVCGLSCEYRDLLWSAGLRGVTVDDTDDAGRYDGAAGGGNEEKIRELIYGVLAGLVRDGIPQRDIENALLAIEFENREVKRAGGPWSLALLCRSLRGWIHGRKPWETLLFEDNFRKLKARLKKEPRYFETLLEKYYINNKNSVLISVRPVAGLPGREENALREKLKAIEKKLKPEEIRRIKSSTALLEKRQRTTEPKALLKLIPHLGTGDLENKIELIPVKLYNPGGVLTLSHKLWTRGICYFDIAFPFDVLEPEDYLYMNLFAHCITGLGVPGLNYAEVSSLLARNTGGFFAQNSVFPLRNGRDGTVKTGYGDFDITGRDWIKFRMKCLDEKTDSACELVLNIIRNADFSDERRLRDLILEIRNDVEASLAGRGSFYAVLRAAAGLSLMNKKAEILSGLTMFRSVRNIAALETREIARRLEGIRDRLIAGSGPVISITTENEPAALAAVEKFCSSLGAVRNRNPASLKPENFQNIIYPPPGTDSRAAAPPVPAKPEIFFPESLQTGFAGLNIRGRDRAEKNSVLDAAFAHYLSSGPLWDSLRGIGGAYGAHANADVLQGIVQFSTFRDPAPLDSLEAIPGILKQCAEKKIDKTLMEKVIIGTYSGLKQPGTNAQKGDISFRRFLSGISDEERAERLSCLLAAGPEDLRETAANLYKNYEASPPCGVIISGKTAAEESARKTGVPAQPL